jgi:hypothetical protein
MSKEKKVVWILGAGFSRSLGGPLLSELFTWESLEAIFATYPNFCDQNQRKILERIVRAYLFGVYDIELSDTSKEQVAVGHATDSYRRHLWKHSEEFLERLDIAAASGRSDRDYTFMARVFELANSIRSGGKSVVDDLNECNLYALKLMAAECDKFLVDSSTQQEKWLPYNRFAKLLNGKHTIISFNYDKVLDILYPPPPGYGKPVEKSQYSNMATLRPREWNIIVPSNRSWDRIPLFDTPRVLKLHGSVNWYKDENNEIRLLLDKHFLNVDKPALATPGITKHRFIENNNNIRSLWNLAENEIRTADIMVFIGYRFPPSDAYSRDRILSSIGCNVRERTKYNTLVVHTVLGDDTNHPDSRRLKGLLVASGCQDTCIVQHPMWAEDFLGCYNYEDPAQFYRDVYQ